MAKIKFDNGVEVEFAGNPTPQDVEEVAQTLQRQGRLPGPSSQPKQPGFIQSAVQSIAQPVGKLGLSLASVPLQAASIGADLMGRKDIGDKLWQGVEKLKSGVDAGYLGNIKSFQGDGSVAGLKDAIGTGAQVGSLAVPGGAGLGGKLISGGVSGAAYGAGETLAEGGSFGDAAIAGLKGGALGVGTAGVLHGAGKTVSAIPKIAGSASKFVTSQSTGLSPKTISTILKNPEKITDDVIKSFDDTALATDVNRAIKGRLSELSNTGKEYNLIREARKPVEIPFNSFKSVIQKYGLDLDADGKIVTSIESVPLKQGDLNDLQRFYSQYGKENSLTSNSLLNTRQALDQLADWGAEKSDVSNRIAKDLRVLYDTAAKKQLPELAALDAKFAPEVKLLNKVKKDYLNADGSLKDNAVTKLRNLGNKGREQVLGRLEKIVPGIGERINIAAAIDDIAASQGLKVGAYVRGGLAAGFTLGGGNPIAALAGMLVANPAIAVPLIRTFGKTRGVASPVVEKIISNIQKGKPVSDAVKKFIYAAMADAVNETPEDSKVKKSTDDYLKELGF